MQVEVAVVGAGGVGDGIAAVVRPLAQDEEVDRVFPVDRGVCKVLGVVLEALVHVLGAGAADAALLVDLSPRGGARADMAGGFLRHVQHGRGHLLSGL